MGEKEVSDRPNISSMLHPKASNALELQSIIVPSLRMNIGSLAFSKSDFYFPSLSISLCRIEK